MTPQLIRIKRTASVALTDQATYQNSKSYSDVNVYQISKMLCDVVLLGINFDVSDWCRVIDLYVYQLASRESLESTSQMTKFALTIAMIGSQHSELFQHVFRLFNAWEKIQGPYWIIQAELQRHYCLHVIRSKLHYLSKQSNVIVERIFSVIDMDIITNIPLREELQKLQVELQGLLNQLIEAKPRSRRESILEVYCQNYPLESFTKWFLQWALDEHRYPLVYRKAADTNNVVHTFPNTTEASYDEFVRMQSRRSVGTQSESTTYHETKVISRELNARKRMVDNKLSRTHHTVDIDNGENAYYSEDDVVIGGDKFKVMKEVELMEYEDGFVGSCANSDYNRKTIIEEIDGDDDENTIAQVQINENDKEASYIQYSEDDSDRDDSMEVSDSGHQEPSTAATVWETFHHIITDYINPEE